MTNQAYLLGIDIGATSVKVGAFTPEGTMTASASAPNAPSPQPNAAPEWRIWDMDRLWSAICDCSRNVMSQLGENAEIRGAAVSSFGTDGLPVDAQGVPLYPCISWHCGRTVMTAERVSEQLGKKNIYRVTGYHNYAINALNRLVWLKDNAPQALEKCAAWLAVQDYIAYRLTGEFSTDRTHASTMMCLDIRKRDWAVELLRDVGIDAAILSPLVESGMPIGKVHAQGAEESGIPVGTVIAAGGHDTELAILGAGVSRKETFLDINGTWEILMAITDCCNPTGIEYSHGLDWECHAMPGWWNCQALMIAGGAIEWMRERFYGGASYETLMQEAEAAPLGSNRVMLLPAFVRGMGPAQAYDPLAALLGIDINTTRGDIARALFEGLTYQFYKQINALEECLHIDAETIRVTGGGQKNPFWMRMKADVSGRALDVLQEVESTLLGAALLAGVGGGVYRDANEAMEAIRLPMETVEPNMENHKRYRELYDHVISRIPMRLEEMHKTVHEYWDGMA